MSEILQHNAHFRDNGCRFEPHLMVFLCTLGQELEPGRSISIFTRVWKSQ